MAKHVQITQNNKFTISLQYFKKEVSDEVDFLHADKNESFLQVDTMIFDGNGQAFQSSQNCINTLNIKVCYKVISSLLMGMIKYSQSD